MSYIEHVEVVEGDAKADIMLFTLSTCIWCRKTKALLNELGVRYSYVDVDLLEGADKDEAHQRMWEFDQSTAFPTIIISDGERVIHGLAEDKIRALA